jgi:hypothetical protein
MLPRGWVVTSDGLPVKGVVLPAVGKLITLRDLAVSVSALLECSTLDIPYLFDDNHPSLNHPAAHLTRTPR